MSTFRSATMARDWRQFRLLWTDASRQLVDAALLSRENDPRQFVLWLLALVATPPFFFASRQFLTYTALGNAPEDAVLRVALGHHLFFVVYSMLVAALLAAMVWEAVFPDGRDQEIVGALPVRPEVFAASRLAAALQVALVTAGAINLPSAVLYSLFCLGHPAFRYNLIGLVAGHALSTVLAFLLVFCALLTVRGVVAVVFGAGAGRWLGAALQLTSVVALVEAFFFLPGILATAARYITDAEPTALVLPPVWFVALHDWCVGTMTTRLEPAVWRGLTWTSLALVATVPIYLLPARWLGRRALEKRSRERAAGTTFLVRSVATLTRATPAVRGIYLFAVTSLVRSRRHVMVIASYMGMAVGICLAALYVFERRGTILINSPASWMLSLPMVFLFFGVVALRATFRVPTEIDANWPFRLTPPSPAACVNASILVTFTLAILPIVIVTAILVAPTWPWTHMALVALFQSLAGIGLAECLLLKWAKVPFASSYAPSPDVLKAWWPVWGIAMFWFSFKLSAWQFVAVQSPALATGYVATSIVVVVAARLIRRRELRHRALEFDLPDDGSAAQLRLSEAAQ